MFKLFAALSLFSIVACGGSGTVDVRLKPSEVAMLFFNSINAGDIDNVKDNVCFDDPAEKKIFEEYLERLFIPGAGKQSRDCNAGYVVLSEVISGDTANVELRGTTIADKTAKIKVRLLDREGWKVDGSQAVLHRVE